MWNNRGRRSEIRGRRSEVSNLINPPYLKEGGIPLLIPSFKVRGGEVKLSQHSISDIPYPTSVMHLTSDFRTLTSDSGIALVIVIFIILILMVLGLNLSYTTRLGLLEAKNFKDDIAIEYAMLEAFNEALVYISKDRDPVIDYVDDKGIIHLDDREPFPVDGQFNNINLKVLIRDEESRLNLNMINDIVLRRLLKYADVPDDKLQIIIDSFRDWLDPDDLHRPSGAEKEYYEGLPTPYRPKNGPLSVPEELMLIKEFKKDYFYGSEERKGIEDLITTFGSGKLNINTVPLEVMEVLGLTNIDIETIISQRNALKGYRAIPPHLTGLFQAISSSTFRIDITSESPYKRIIAIVQRIPAKKGYTFKTLYWKEEG